MLEHSYLSNADMSAIDNLYEQYLADKNSVDYGWQRFFEGFDLAYDKSGLDADGKTTSQAGIKEINVLNLINNGYRSRGHFFTRTNPVRDRRKYEPTLAIENFGLEKGDLDKFFNAGHTIGIGRAKLKEIIQHLENTYCKSIGVEYTYIPEPERRKWLQEKLERNQNTPEFDLKEKKEILRKLNEAVTFENFLHTKYVGQKRFSLEGLETLIPALDAVIEYGHQIGVEEFVLGMAHRGRLNVLANIMQKTYHEIFGEFEGKAYKEAVFQGDVKYHMGYRSEVVTNNGDIVRLTLAANPSHLESVNPVVKGMAKAKLDNRFGKDVDKICPILIHGDASISGQGIIYEVVQMSKLLPYDVGGCMHIVTNNQIGFTTNYIDGRSSIYSTDIGKVTKCPIFHVNADDVEAVVHTIKIAMEYKQKFNSDVFVDLLGYRKYGHNEGDEPRFTQPVLYKSIAKHPNPREIYLEKLKNQGDIEANLAKEMQKDFKALLQQKLDEVREDKGDENNQREVLTWAGFRAGNEKDFSKSPKTAISTKQVLEYSSKIIHIPEDHQTFKKIKRIFDDRKKMIDENRLDWAMGELLAYASLLDEGTDIRMTGQDCERGTFSHRHAVIISEDGTKEHIPLQHISEKQGTFEIHNSLLSEFAVLGFEYGYSNMAPNALTIWEAQFGDFANGSQVTIDQYIASGQTKWGNYSGLVMLLPHGHEGQGPEHSSARLERYLQLCANQNMQVCNITTPANFFHALRRQIHRNFRVPLLVMSPKSLLRHTKAVSEIKDFTSGGFKEMIKDNVVEQNARKLIFCSGKIYFDLLEKQQKENIVDVAIVRVEQLYPMPENQMIQEIKKHPKANVLWVQEEPKNMGSWQHMLRYDWPTQFTYLGRQSSATPATGYASVHLSEQNEIIKKAFE